MIEAWGSYREAVRRYYALAGEALRAELELEGPDAEAATTELAEVARYSRDLAEIGEAELRDAEAENYDELATQLLAAASVDVAVACEALQIAPERPDPDDRFPTIADEPIEPAMQLLGEADELFPQMGLAAGGGVDPTRAQLGLSASQCLDSLVSDASPPTLRFALGLLPALDHGVILGELGSLADDVANLTHHVNRFKGHILDLLASGYRKLLDVSGQTAEHLANEGTNLVLGEAGNAVRNGAQHALARALGWLAGQPEAENSVQAAVARPEALTPADTAAVEVELRTMTKGYGEQMVWTGRIAKWLGRAAPLISALAAPIGGPVVVAGLDGIGVGFVLYTLRVRIRRGVPARARSVVAIVEDGLAHCP
jgi:hypothetical protein